MHMKVSVRQTASGHAVEPKVSLKCTGRRLTQSKERRGTTHEGLSVGSWHVDNTFMGWNHAATSTLLEVSRSCMTEAMSYIMCTPSSDFTIIFITAAATGSILLILLLQLPKAPALHEDPESSIERSNGVRREERTHLHGPVGRRDGGAWGQREC